MKTEIKFALIFVILSFIWNIIEYAAGLHSTHISIHPYFVTPFFIILTVVIYLLAIREKRKNSGGQITFSKAFMTGVMLTFFIIILNPAFQYIYSEFINTNFYSAFIQNDVATGKLTRQDAEDYYNFKNFIVRGSVYRIIMSISATLIIAVFIKKKDA
ncbi:MAG: DUF4199 domain-containing protein [Ignavibacteria bacterium]